MKRLFTMAVVFTTVLWTMGLGALVPVASATATVEPGDLIKASGPAVYYYAADGMRYTFPDQNTYMTWYDDFEGVKTISDDELASIDLAGNVTVRPGTTLVKIQTVPKVYAVLPNGQLRHVADEDAAEALYGEDWNKGIMIVSDAFWNNYTDIDSELDGTEYPEGTLVQYEGSTDVYYVNADGTVSKIADEAAFNANMWSWDDIVTTTLAMPTVGDPITEAMYNDTSQGGGAGESGTVVTGGDLNVSLNSGTPEAQYVSKGAQNVVFVKFDFASSSSTTVDKIVLERKGLGYDADISTIKLYDGATQIGSDQSLNTSTHQVTFNNLDWTVTGTEVLTVKANIAASPNGTNDYFEIVEVESDGTVAGLPQSGNAMQFSALTVSDFYVRGITSSSTVISGATDQELGCFYFETAIGSSTVAEGFDVQSVMFTNTGSSSDSDLSNFVLKQGSVELGTADSMTNGTITIDMSADPYEMDATSTKRVCLYGDISDGITVSKNFKSQIADTGDVVAVGQNTHSTALIEYDSSNPFTSQTSKTVTIGQGSATIATDSAYDVTAGARIVKGAEQEKMGAFKVTAGSDEGIRMTKVKFYIAGALGTDFSNWQLYKIVDEEEVLIPVSGSTSGLTVTFEDTNSGLLDVAKTENESFVVRADVSGSVDGAETPYIYINVDGTTTNTDVRIQGLDSTDYITDGMTVSSDAYSTGDRDTLALDVETTGTLTITKASTSPAAAAIAKGVDDLELLDINFYATGELMTVNSLELTLYKTADGLVDDTNTVVASGEVSNVRLLGADGTPYGSACTPSSGVCSFSPNLEVPADENVVLSVVADTSATVTYVYATLADGVAADTEATRQAAVDTTGYYSSGDVTESITSDIVGGLMTAGSPGLTAAMSNSPIDSSYVAGSDPITIGKLLLTASTVEDVNVTSIKISADDDATLGGAEASVASANWQSVKLVDANTGVQYGVTKNLTDGGGSAVDYASFTGITNLKVTKGQTKVLNVIATPTGTSGDFYYGVVAPSTEIIAAGFLSGATATVSPSPSAPITSAKATLVSAGQLKVNKAADMPVAAQLVAGTSGNELAKYKFEAAYEDVDITLLPVFFSGTAADVANVKLYQDGVQIGDTNGYQLSADDSAKIVNLPAGTFVVEKDVPTYLSMKVELSPKSQLTSSATSVYIGIGDDAATSVDTNWANNSGSPDAYGITAVGVGSGTTLTEACINSTAYDGATSTAGCNTTASAGYIYGSNGFTVHDGILTVALDDSSPSGVQTGASDEDLMVFKLSATGDEITVNEMEFCWSGNAAISGGGNTYLKNFDDSVTYASLTDAEFDTYWSLRGDGTDAGTVEPMFDVPASITEAKCFSFGDNADATGATASSNVKAFTVAPIIGNGDTLRLKLIGDTTGAANPKTLKLTVGPNSLSTCDDDGSGAGSGDTTCAATTSGIEWQASDAVEVDKTTTTNLPLSSNTLSY